MPGRKPDIQRVGPSAGPERQSELLSVTQQMSSGGKPPRCQTPALCTTPRVPQRHHAQDPTQRESPLGAPKPSSTRPSRLEDPTSLHQSSVTFTCLEPCFCLCKRGTGCREPGR